MDKEKEMRKRKNKIRGKWRREERKLQENGNKKEDRRQSGAFTCITTLTSSGHWLNRTLRDHKEHGV